MLNSRKSNVSSSKTGSFGSIRNGGFGSNISGSFGSSSFNNIEVADSVSDYKIESLQGLETSSANLARYNQQITNNINSLNYILKSVKENWENEEGLDIQSILLNLNANISTLSNEIQPIITKYVDTINQIVAETRLNQSKNI